MSHGPFTELLRGKGAHADPLACVEDLSAEAAARAIDSFPHSVGQIVFHLNFWMNYDLRRIRGERPKYPEHSSESFPPAGTPKNAAEWDKLRRDFAWFLGEWSELAETSQTELNREIEPMHDGHTKQASTLEALLWQTVAHNSYHIGQIAMIRRGMGQWPPRGGGDTW